MRYLPLILWVIPVLILLWLVDKHVVFSGTLTLEYNVGEKSNAFSGFASKEPYQFIGKPTRGGGENAQLITTTPMYFDLHVPRPFEKAKVSIIYQNPDHQPVVQLGVKQSNNAYSISKMATQYELFDTPPQWWNRSEEDGVVFLQKNIDFFQEYTKKQNQKETALANLAQENQSRLEDAQKEYSITQNNDTYRAAKALIEKNFLEEKKRIETNAALLIDSSWTPPYASLKDFFSNPPDAEKVAVADYDLASKMRISSYKPLMQERTITSSIRGSHELSTYIGGNETLSFSFLIQSINRHEDPDTFRLVLKSGDRVLREKEITLETNVKRGVPSEEATLTLTEPKLPEGRYTILINAPDDIFIKRIETLQKLLMFKGLLYLGDNDEYSMVLGDKSFPSSSIYTSSTRLIAYTSHEKGFQTLLINRRPLAITKMNTEVRAEGFSGNSNILVPKNDVQIKGDGYFAFSKEEMFNLPEKFDAFSEKSDESKYDFIIGANQSPEKMGDWLEAETTVEVPILYTNKGMVGMFIDFPGLPEHQREVFVKSVKVELTKPPITYKNIIQKARQWLTAVW